MMSNVSMSEVLSVSENDLADRIVINVGGIKFETRIATLQNIEGTRLSWLTENINPNVSKLEDFFFDRHPGAFVYILNYYRTGKLHIPTDMCGPAFEEELEFWGIDEKQMEPCCWESFTKHREAEANLKSFEGPGFEDLYQPKPTKKSLLSMCKGDRAGCLDYYLEKTWALLDDPHSTKMAKIFSLLSCFMIIISVSSYCASTMDVLKENSYLRNINYLCVVFFTLECTLRLLSTPNPKEFIRDYKNWIDFISVVPSYLVLLFPKNDWVKNLVIIRVLRVFKFFKLSYGLQVLLQTLKASSYELVLLLLILLIPLVIFSSLVYAVEYNLDRPSKFTSVPKTFWWCIITMTTVGYGDLVPKTWPGQMIGSICSIFGLLIVALPISVIGGNFSLYYAHVRARLNLPRKKRALQENLIGQLRHPLSLSIRNRDRKTLIRTQHHAIRLKPDANVSPLSARKIMQRQECFGEILNSVADSSSHNHSTRSNSVETIRHVSGQSSPEKVPLVSGARCVRRNAIMSTCKSEKILSHDYVTMDSKQKLPLNERDNCYRNDFGKDENTGKRTHTPEIAIFYADSNLCKVNDLDNSPLLIHREVDDFMNMRESQCYEIGEVPSSAHNFPVSEESDETTVSFTNNKDVPVIKDNLINAKLDIYKNSAEQFLMNLNKVNSMIQSLGENISKSRTSSGYYSSEFQDKCIEMQSINDNLQSINRDADTEICSKTSDTLGSIKFCNPQWPSSHSKQNRTNSLGHKREQELLEKTCIDKTANGNIENLFWHRKNSDPSMETIAEKINKLNKSNCVNLEMVPNLREKRKKQIELPVHVFKGNDTGRKNFIELITMNEKYGRHPIPEIDSKHDSPIMVSSSQP